MRYLEVSNISDSGIPYAKMIMDGRKTWEIRWHNTSYRGIVAIIFQNKILGTVKIVDVFSATPKELAKFKNHKSNYRRMKKYASRRKLKKLYVWVLNNPTKFTKPKEIKYNFINDFSWSKVVK